MKKRYLAGAIVLTALLSVGFRYDTAAPAISTPYNIYLYDTLLLVSDSLEGFLVYSVANVQAPRFKARLPLKGNRGMAMKDSIIYANSWGGILALQLVNDTDYRVTSVIKDDPYHSDMIFQEGYYSETSLSPFGCYSASAPMSADKASPSGSGGSYAIFAVIDSFLYYINNRSLITMDIRDPAKPQKVSETPVDWSIETLFPTRNYLFIGGSNGMYVMDRSDPSNPTFISQITHFRARDPVVVHDTMAYVTLRAANDPRAEVDELMVVSLGSITNPKLIKEMALASPWGLTVRDTLLYVAQGASGMSLFSLAAPCSPLALKQWTTPQARDFIWDNDRLYMMCPDGVKIYSTADPVNPALISKID